jgi:hypothetical protein
VVNHGQRPAYLADLVGSSNSGRSARIAVEEIRRLRWTLRQIIALADDAPRLTDRELRARLVALAESGPLPSQ